MEFQTFKIYAEIRRLPRFSCGLDNEVRHGQKDQVHDTANQVDAGVVPSLQDDPADNRKTDRRPRSA